jgi:hypothetical protein
VIAVDHAGFDDRRSQLDHLLQEYVRLGVSILCEQRLHVFEGDLALAQILQDEGIRVGERGLTDAGDPDRRRNRHPVVPQALQTADLTLVWSGPRQPPQQASQPRSVPHLDDVGTPIRGMDADDAAVAGALLQVRERQRATGQVSYQFPGRAPRILSKAVQSKPGVRGMHLFFLRKFNAKTVGSDRNRAGGERSKHATFVRESPAVAVWPYGAIDCEPRGWE